MAEKDENGSSMGCFHGLVLLTSLAVVALSPVLEFISWLFPFDFPFLWVFGPVFLTLVVSAATAGQHNDVSVRKASHDVADSESTAFEEAAVAGSSPSRSDVRRKSHESTQLVPSRSGHTLGGAPGSKPGHYAYASSNGRAYWILDDGYEDSVTPDWSFKLEYELLDCRPGYRPYISSTGKLYYLHGSPRFATWQQAEISAQHWMRTHGYPDAQLTPPGPDGGVDVFSQRAIAQVKDYQHPIGPGPIHELADLTLYSKYRGWRAVFFSTSGYTADASSCGQERGVRLYERDLLHQVWARVA